jgi:hypothetical protein
VHVVEAQLHGIVADRVDADDLDVPFAGYGLALGSAVALDLGRGAHNSEILSRKIEGGSVVEDDPQGAPVLGQAEFGRPALWLHGGGLRGDATRYGRIDRAKPSA